MTLRQFGPQRPIAARRVKQLGQQRALEPAGCRQRERRKERRLGDADLGIGGGGAGARPRRYPDDAPADPKAAPPGCPETWSHGLDRDRKFRGRLADQNRDGVLQLRAQNRGIDRLRLGRFELGFRLAPHRLAPATPTAYWLRVSFSAFSYSVDRIVEQADLRVLRAQHEVVLGERSPVRRASPHQARRQLACAVSSLASTVRRILPQRSISQEASSEAL